MYNLLSVSLLTIFIFSRLALADQVVLKNGDRLTGAVVKSDGKELVIKTEFAGEVTVMIPFVVEAWEIAAQNKERKNTQLRFMNRSLVSTRWI